MLSSAYSVSSFNDLLSLRAADEVFSRSKREHLSQMGELIRKHGLEQQIGIQLLHTHFKLRDGEKLVEAQISHEGKIEVGQSVSIGGPQSSSAAVVPRVWALVDDAWQAVEFAPAHEGEDQLTARLSADAGQQFLREFAALVIGLGVSHVVGLGVVEAVFAAVAALHLRVIESSTGVRELTKMLLPEHSAEAKQSTEAFWTALKPEDGPCCGCWCTVAAGHGHTGDNTHC